MFKLSRDDLNFEQGKELLNNNKNLAQNLSLMEQTTGPELGSIIGALQNDESIQSKYAINIRNISKLEEKYNLTLAEYTQNYKLMMDEAINNKINVDTNSKLWKKLVLLNNKLIILAKQLLQDTDSLVINDKNITMQLGTLKDGINVRINNLENDKKKFNDVQETFSVESMLTNRFISIVILCIILIIFLLYFSFINNTRVLYTILLILIIILLYKIVKYFINHIY